MREAAEQRGVTGASSLFELMDRPVERDLGQLTLPRTEKRLHLGANQVLRESTRFSFGRTGSMQM